MINLKNYKKKLNLSNYEYNYTHDKKFLILREKKQLHIFEKKNNEFIFLFNLKNKNILKNWIKLNQYIYKKKGDHNLLYVDWISIND